MLFLARRAVPQRLLFVLFASKNGVCTLPLLLLPVATTRSNFNRIHCSKLRMLI